jgi:hypothetical protein
MPSWKACWRGDDHAAIDLRRCPDGMGAEGAVRALLRYLASLAYTPAGDVGRGPTSSPPPRGHANSDGMPPVGVGVARSIRSVISPSNGARENIGIASAPQIETILPWLLHIRGIGVVGQPPLGKPGTNMVQSTWTRAEA